MILQYLIKTTEEEIVREHFLDKSIFIEDKKTKDVSIEFECLSDTSSVICTIIIEGNSLKLAKYMSEINEYMLSLNPTILINESSACFNRTLYPLVNKFERKLRTMLYLKAIGEDNNSPVKELETLTFEKVYELLFTNESFIKKMREIVNDKQRNSSKSFYLKKIKEIEETTTWDAIVNSHSLDWIKEQFLTIIDYRNDVMHAHNINYSQYYEAQKIFRQAIVDLETEIGHLIQSAEYREISRQELLNITNELLNEEPTDDIINGLYLLTK